MVVQPVAHQCLDGRTIIALILNGGYIRRKENPVLTAAAKPRKDVLGKKWNN